jgi:pre-mRNA-splicing helicase BRR2
MADREELQKRYGYHAMSNKVEQADRSGARRNRGEGTGEVETLAGRTDIGRMGDRVVDGPAAVASKEDELKKQKAKRKTASSNGNDPEQQAAAVKRKKASQVVMATGETILDLSNLAGYQPTTASATAAYGNILTLIGSRNLLGSQGPAFLRDAAEEVILIVKDDGLRDPERHEQISRLLTGKGPKTAGGLLSEQFTALVQLGKQLDDYHDKKDDGKDDDDDNGGGTEEVDEMGVAVLFDESDEEGDKQGDSDVDQDVVQDSSSSDDDDDEVAGQAVMADESSDDDGANNADEEKVLVQGASKKKSSHKADRILSVHEIDAHYLQRQLSSHFNDADAAAARANEILEILDFGGKSATDPRECENALLSLMGFELFDTITLLMNNRVRVWACVSMKRAQSDEERNAIEKALAEEATGEGKRVWDELHSKGRAEDWTRDRIKGITDSMKTESKDVSKALDSIGIKGGDQADTGGTMKMETDEQATELDLEALALQDGAHTMSNKQCNLPDTSWRAMKKGYEEVHVPAVRSVIPKDEKLISISELPSWTHAAFKGMDKLNRVQSKLCDVALRSSENLLLCAPTGAGKTNVACLAMLNILGQYRREHSAEDDDDSVDEDAEKKESFDLSAFKIVYVAPMKALVQEVVKNFSDRLGPYGINVRELSGDSSLTRQQISETQLLVTTPEKWDVVTRQGEGRAFTQLVKLVIIDEIHLLHDERGPVLESIVARVIRQVETTAEPIRLVGLSATLPNYADVATFLRVNPEKGLFFFDHSFRPVPLQMQYIGITERNAFKRFQLQNEICYEKAMDQRRNANQMLIFVHSRAETGKTAKALRDLALERDELSNFVRDGSGSQEILREESSAAKNADLKDVLPYGFAIHHAGMAREDRELVEDLFADRHIAVLCCTATLAWGVNLYVSKLPLFSLMWSCDDVD